MSKVTATGTLSLTDPSTLALIAVHKHSAASRSATPFTTLQHFSLGLLPISSLTNPNQLPQTPNLSVLMGHFCGAVEGGGVADFGGQGRLSHAKQPMKNKLSSIKVQTAFEWFGFIFFKRNFHHEKRGYKLK